MPALGALAGSWTAAAGLAAFLVLAVLETHRPWDVGTAAGSRWVTNLVLYGAVVGLLALVAPQHWAGVILEGWDSGPLAWVAGHCGAWAVLAAGLLLMDALAYGLHRMQHLRLFWPLHAIHHADAQVDVTTGLRHHPGEALVNGLVGAALLAVLGLPPWVATVYGLAAIVWDVWSHANVALPPRLERTLSALVVTPGLHRIHHSQDPAHFGTNFGGVLTLWDRLFGTWRPQSAEALRFGVPGAGTQGLAQSLAAPFRRYSAPQPGGSPQQPPSSMA